MLWSYCVAEEKCRPEEIGLVTITPDPSGAILLNALSSTWYTDLLSKPVLHFLFHYISNGSGQYQLVYIIIYADNYVNSLSVLVLPRNVWIHSSQGYPPLGNWIIFIV